MSRWFKKSCEVVIALMFIWVIAGFVSFRVRHPWVTDIECMMYWPDAMMFRRVDYRDMRPYERL